MWKGGLKVCRTFFKNGNRGFDSQKRTYYRKCRGRNFQSAAIHPKEMLFLPKSEARKQIF